MKTVHWGRMAAAGAISLAAATAHAEVFGGVEFPQGAISFADQVVSYTNDPRSTPQESTRGAFNALGAPDYDANNVCATQASCSFVSLGAGGTLILRFTDNVLTGSDSSADDLWIFEIGPDVEDTTVDVSVDGLTWLSVGAVTGSTRGIDIDAFGYDSSFAFSFVRLIDVYNEGQQGNGGSVGADIDAVGAISTRRIIVDNGIPEPGTWALMLLGFGALGTVLRRSNRLVAV
jgi:hypothetical protein